MKLRCLPLITLATAICMSANAVIQQPWVWAANFLLPDGGNNLSLKIQYQACDKNLNCVPDFYSSDLIPSNALYKISYGWYDNSESFSTIRITKASAYLNGEELYANSFDTACYATTGQTVNFSQSVNSNKILCQTSNSQ